MGRFVIGADRSQMTLLPECLGADQGRRGNCLIEKRMDRSELASCKQFRQVATTIYLPLRHGGDGLAQAAKVDPRELTTAHG
jgi:hypothetical protein